jgi:lysozyme family protein
MAASSYDACLARLLAHEGGYTNNSADPGGPTNFGITIADYRKYVMPSATPADVKAMSLADAKRIYRARYWDALRCDDLPAGVDYAVFDYGVNSGIGRAAKVLRRCLALPADRARIADDVVAAARTADPARLVTAVCDERLAFLKSLKTWPVFGRGWERRVNEVKAFALSMTAVPPPSAKPAVARTAATGAAAVSAGAAAHAAGMPLWTVCLAVAAAGLLGIVAIAFVCKGKA